MKRNILLFIAINIFYSQQLSALPSGFLLVAIHLLSFTATSMKVLDEVCQNQEEGLSATECALKGLVFMTKAGVAAIGAAALATGILSSAIPALSTAYLLDINSLQNL